MKSRSNPKEKNKKLVDGLVKSGVIKDKRVAAAMTAALTSIDVHQVVSKTRRRRSEDGRLDRFGWKKEENGRAGKRPRFVYTSPTGDEHTSMKKAMAAIRLTAAAKGGAKCEQSV